jgi:hypothetical protein
MSRSRAAYGLAVLSLTVSLGFSDAATAETRQNKITYEQAWARCKALLDKTSPRTAENDNERYARGGACMKKFGYRL